MRVRLYFASGAFFDAGPVACEGHGPLVGASLEADESTASEAVDRTVYAAEPYDGVAETLPGRGVAADA